MGSAAEVEDALEVESSDDVVASAALVEVLEVELESPDVVESASGVAVACVESSVEATSELSAVEAASSVLAGSVDLRSVSLDLSAALEVVFDESDDLVPVAVSVTVSVTVSSVVVSLTVTIPVGASKMPVSVSEAVARVADDEASAVVSLEVGWRIIAGTVPVAPIESDLDFEISEIRSAMLVRRFVLVEPSVEVEESEAVRLSLVVMVELVISRLICLGK